MASWLHSWHGFNPLAWWQSLIVGTDQHCVSLTLSHPDHVNRDLHNGKAAAFSVVDVFKHMQRFCLIVSHSMVWCSGQAYTGA